MSAGLSGGCGGAAMSDYVTNGGSSVLFFFTEPNQYVVEIR